MTASGHPSLTLTSHAEPPKSKWLASNETRLKKVLAKDEVIGCVLQEAVGSRKGGRCGLGVAELLVDGGEAHG